MYFVSLTFNAGGPLQLDLFCWCFVSSALRENWFSHVLFNKSLIKCENWKWPEPQVLLLHHCHGYGVALFQNFAISLTWLSWHSHPTISKFNQLFTMESFWIVNPSFYFFIIFLEINRNYIMLIMITIASNITVLVSQNIIFFAFFMPMSHGVNKKTPPSAFPHLPLSYQIFTRFICCFTRNNWSGYLRKTMHFQRK